RVFVLDRQQRDKADFDFLDRVFHKLLLNFTWWVNRKDADDNNVFQGGFLGLDNIGVFDRSAPLPGGGHIEQADGTSWMAAYCLNMLTIALELAGEDPVYQDIATKFFEHFLRIAAAMADVSEEGISLWDPQDGFFYDVLHMPNGDNQLLRVRSMVGLLPLCAVTVFDGKLLEDNPEARENLKRFLEKRPELRQLIHDATKTGLENRRMAAILNEKNLRRVLARMLDEKEFLSPHGIRSLSRYHEEHPYVYTVGQQEFRVPYLPGESDTGVFGGNSNWRGPVWMPVNGLILRALLQYYMYFGDAFTIECPTGSGRQMTLYEVAENLAERLTSIFVRDASGRRPVYGDDAVFQNDPQWRDYILFYEYFHGDSGAGLGASHQTGWTGVIARIMHLFATTNSQQVALLGKKAAAVGVKPAPAMETAARKPPPAKNRKRDDVVQEKAT
ncbi:MAG: MGH1-like glycoside hydrolase domain-containing protein, partial [Phycisphaerae bacterium]